MSQPMFKLESEMGPLVCEWMQKSGLTVKSEFSLPWGICDFVGVSLNLAHVRKRIALKQTKPIGPMRRVELLEQIPDEKTGFAVSIETLERASIREDNFRSTARDLEQLIRDRFVTATSSGEFQKRNGWVPLQKRIVAVELKLARISEAVCQAAANKAFATESYVALPWPLAYRHANRLRASVFVNAGIGILAVTDNSCRVVLKPSKLGFEAHATLQIHCVERFWRSRGS